MTASAAVGCIALANLRAGRSVASLERQRDVTSIVRGMQQAAAAACCAGASVWY